MSTVLSGFTRQKLGGKEGSGVRHSKQGSSEPSLMRQDWEERAAALHSSSPQAGLWAWAELGLMLESLGAQADTDLEWLTT